MLWAVLIVIPSPLLRVRGISAAAESATRGHDGLRDEPFRSKPGVGRERRDKILSGVRVAPALIF